MPWDGGSLADDSYEDLGGDPAAPHLPSPPGVPDFGAGPGHAFAEPDADLFAPPAAGDDDPFASPEAAFAAPPRRDPTGTGSGLLVPGFLRGTTPQARKSRWLVFGGLGAVMLVVFLVVFLVALPDGEDGAEADAGNGMTSEGAGDTEVGETATGDSSGGGSAGASSANSGSGMRTAMASAGAGGGYSIEEPTVPAAIERLSKLRRRRRAQKQRRLASRLHARMRYERAETWWRRSLTFHPESSESASGLARSLARREQSDEALAWARRGVEENPRNARSRETLGDILLEQGDVEGAIDQYRAGLRARPNSRRLRTRLRRARARRP